MASENYGALESVVVGWKDFKGVVEELRD